MSRKRSDFVESVASSELLVRPQPVGVFPVPVSLLLLPPGDAEALQRLVLGDRSIVLPQPWEFYARALRGEPIDATNGFGSEPLADYNRFVLSGNAAEYERLKVELSGQLRELLEVAAYYHGLTDLPPSGDALDDELLALALMMRASHWIEQEDSDRATKELAQAVELVRNCSPIFAAQLLGQMAQLVPDGRRAVQICREATKLMSQCLDDRLRAESWVHLGQACQAQGDRSLLFEAVKAYQQALRCGLSLGSNQDLYAVAQTNVGLAYLAMPMTEAGDHLRTGIAVQSFREALKVYDRETSPEMWVSTQLNLANALQYMKSAHPEENLAQAVEIYEELLSVRKRALDPLGYARLLANQANALAHLGVFGPAMEKATEAHKLFHWHGEPDLAETMLELTSEINSRLSERVETSVS